MQKKWVIIRSCALIGILLSSGSFAEEIRIGGGGAAISSLIVPAAETFQEEYGIPLSIKVSAPADGLIELDQGKVDVTTAAVSFDSMIQGAAALGVNLDPAAFHHFVLGENRTKIFVNKSVRVAKLTKEQLKGIFTGRITNWKKVGGENRKIVVVWGSQTPEQNELFSSIILDGQPVTKKLVQATDYAAIRKKITETPGAIGIDQEGLIIGNLTIPVIPDLSSARVVVTKGEPSAAVKKLITFLTEVSGLD